MGRGLDGYFDTQWRCAVLKDREGVVSRVFPVALARGKHLFPFRTEQLSPSAPMVLGSQGPGRVGRRRFFGYEEPPQRGGSSSLALASLRERSTLGCGERALALRSEIARRASPQCPRSPCAGRCGRRPADGAKAGQLAPCGLTGPAMCEAVCDCPHAQSTPVRMIRLDPLVLVDLPVDVVVVLEQQERTGEAVRGRGALSKMVRGEHVFVR